MQRDHRIKDKGSATYNKIYPTSFSKVTTAYRYLGRVKTLENTSETKIWFDTAHKF
jgi:hypothetical protein